MLLVAYTRTRRMHTVPEGYFEAFAVREAARRTSRVWRFERSTADSKLFGVGDAEVARDIYAVFNDDGAPDTGIEDELLCALENAFCTARNLLLQRKPLSKENWSSLFRFTAAQLLRTPRLFQLVRDDLAADGTPYEQDALPRVMLLLIGRWIPRLARMRGILAYNETGLPLLTCDNPAVTWKKSGDGFICGVDQYDPGLVVSCPLSPTLMFVAHQTPESLKAVQAEQHDIPFSDRKPQTFTSHVDIGSLPEAEVKRMNHICVSNAHRYVYANYSDEPLRRFLQDRFFGAPAPVRRRDLQPIGSPP
jgi:Protein of unknown function (DUF4238)